MSIPKCTSWLGHKFEARHSSEPRDLGRTEKIDLTASGGAAVEAAMRIRVKMTYERDICVRCGFVIERAPNAMGGGK